jgi:hypothetical protein
MALGCERKPVVSAPTAIPIAPARRFKLDVQFLPMSHLLLPNAPGRRTSAVFWSRHRCRQVCRGALAAAALTPGWVHASMFHGETLDQVANGLAWFVVVVMPILAIVIFWKLHVLPEKIAEKRHHPQKEAIHMLCLLSLAFGGLLWPLAWLWAYMRPTLSVMAHGTSKHDDYFDAMATGLHAGTLSPQALDELREELDGMAARGRLPRKLRQLQQKLDDLHAAELVAQQAAEGAA